ncbi:MAG: quinolinate phosphoribosyl transferase [Gemmatimonadaceae bacterium]
MPRRRKRIDPALFRLPLDEIKQGFYTDKYFERTREVLRTDAHSPRVLMQVTGKNAGYLSGVDEAIAILKLAGEDWSGLTVTALYEGDEFEDWDTVMTIEGPYECFAHLETLYLGVLCRRTRICTNTRRLVEAARPKPVLFFGARQDYWGAQPGDGYAAYAGGASSVSTDAQASLFGGSGIGTVPHSLIAAYGGDTVRASKAFAAHVPGVDLIALVDYENDCVRTSLEVARALEGRLWGVRLDTSENLVDRSVIPLMGTFRPTGVNPQLVWNVRNALDAEGFGEVKIVVSGGLNAARVRAFEEEKAPVDVYAVGTSIVHDGRFDFTGDIVMVDGAQQSKVGRELRANPKLDRVK